MLFTIIHKLILPTEGLTLLLHLFFFQCNLAVPLYLICPCLFIYLFFFPLSHTVKCYGLSLYGCS